MCGSGSLSEHPLVRPSGCSPVRDSSPSCPKDLGLLTSPTSTLPTPLFSVSQDHSATEIMCWTWVLSAWRSPGALLEEGRGLLGQLGRAAIPPPAPWFTG